MDKEQCCVSCTRIIILLVPQLLLQLPWHRRIIAKECGYIFMSRCRRSKAQVPEVDNQLKCPARRKREGERLLLSLLGLPPVDKRFTGIRDKAPHSGLYWNFLLCIGTQLKLLLRTRGMVTSFMMMKMTMIMGESVNQATGGNIIVYNKILIISLILIPND